MGLRFRLGDEETVMALNGYMLRDIYPRRHFGLRQSAAFLTTAISLNGVGDPRRGKMTTILGCGPHSSHSTSPLSPRAPHREPHRLTPYRWTSGQTNSLKRLIRDTKSPRLREGSITPPSRSSDHRSSESDTLSPTPVKLSHPTLLSQRSRKRLSPS